MQKFFTFFLFIIVAVVATAQSKPAKEKPSVSLFTIDTSERKPLVLVNGFETDFESSVINPENIESIDVLKNNTATNLYGEKGRYGVILIKTKSGTEFNYITDYINLPNGANSSITKIELNGIVLPNMKKLLIDKRSMVSTMISAVVKTDENCTIISDETLVITTKPIPDKK